LKLEFSADGAIPDAWMIHAARKHRQQARELGGLADYIKVDEMPDYEKDSQQTTVTSARLVREDENDKSDEDEPEDGRMGFAVDLLTKDKQERREAFLAAEREGSDLFWYFFEVYSSDILPIIQMTKKKATMKTIGKSNNSRKPFVSAR